MKYCSRSFAFLLALSTCGLVSDLQAAVPPFDSQAALTFDARAELEKLVALQKSQPELSAECLQLRDQISALDDAMQELPEVQAIYAAYEASDLGRRDDAAEQAFRRERCFSGGSTGIPSEKCVALLAEMEACQAEFDNSPEAKRIRELPQMQELDRLDERFAELCEPSIWENNAGDCLESCDDACESADDAGCDMQDEDSSRLPTTV